MLKNKLNQIRKETKNKLEECVIDYVLDNYSENEDIKCFFEDLLQHGCQSGMVGALIYYTDTVKFYNDYQNEIDSLLKEMFLQTGFKSPQELFGNKWDNEDPLGRDTLNQNLLAWFGFEETARIIADKIGLEI